MADDDVVEPDYGVTFTKYVKLILPLDGYLFWVRSDLVSQAVLASAVLNTSQPNIFTLDQAQVTDKTTTTPATYMVKGSLHYETNQQQTDEEVYSINRVVFTSEKFIQDFNEIGEDVLLIGEWEGLKFAFSTRQSYYQQSGIHHYVGNAVYADMYPQLIDDLSQLDPGLVVSNSIPIWLSMSNWVKADWEPFGMPFALYPAKLSPNNQPPPYAVVNVTRTDPLASTPTLGNRYQHDQLVSDTVKITLWGLNNKSAMEFVDFINQYISLYELMGLMNMPIVYDEKHEQSELNTIAKKKSIEFKVSYLQSQARDIARQLILRAIPSFIFAD